MKKKMTHATRVELANAIRGRYMVATVKDKRRILQEFTAATGYHEKSAIRVLNSSPSPSAAGPVNGPHCTMRPFAVP